MSLQLQEIISLAIAVLLGAAVGLSPITNKLRKEKT